MWNDIENCSVDKAPRSLNTWEGVADLQNTNFLRTGFHSSERREYSARNLK